LVIQVELKLTRNGGYALDLVLVSGSVVPLRKAGFAYIRVFT
jgi:hypothetical protein